MTAPDEEGLDPFHHGPVLELSPDLALRLIAGDGCTSYTTGPGSCFRHQRHPLAKYGADKACNACVAWLALGGDGT